MKLERRIVELPETGASRIAIVADTHSEPHPEVERLLRERAPSLILHGGDIGRLDVLDRLAQLAPMIAVSGNIDGGASGLPDAVVLDLKRAGHLALRIFLTHIAVYGPRLRAEVRKRAEESGAQMVVCGHSHVPFLMQDKGLTVFNPGSIGPRRQHLPITFGVLTVGEMKVTLEHVDCETGGKWLPPRGPPRLR